MEEIANLSYEKLATLDAEDDCVQGKDEFDSNGTDDDDRTEDCEHCRALPAVELDFDYLLEISHKAEAMLGEKCLEHAAEVGGSRAVLELVLQWFCRSIECMTTYEILVMVEPLLENLMLIMPARQLRRSGEDLLPTCSTLDALEIDHLIAEICGQLELDGEDSDDNDGIDDDDI